MSARRRTSFSRRFAKPRPRCVFRVSTIPIQASRNSYVTIVAVATTSSATSIARQPSGDNSRSRSQSFSVWFQPASVESPRAAGVSEAVSLRSRGPRSLHIPMFPEPTCKVGQRYVGGRNLRVPLFLPLERCVPVIPNVPQGQPHFLQRKCPLPVEGRNPSFTALSKIFDMNMDNYVLHSNRALLWRFTRLKPAVRGIPHYPNAARFRSVQNRHGFRRAGEITVSLEPNRDAARLDVAI